MKYAFEVNKVYKHFGKVYALDGVTLNAEEGKIFALLGPNGAGKTTLVRMLSTLMEPDEGIIKVQGVDVMEEPERVRELIGLAGQYAAVDEFLTGRENLYMIGRLYRLDHKTAKTRAEEILQQLNLTDAADRTVRTYSGGMRRRLDVGASLVGRPQVLFLDEPTTGLDPRTRLDLWDIIRNLVASGTTILLTTQYLDEADALANRIAVLDHGKIIAEGTSDELKNRLGGDVVEFTLASSKDKQKALEVAQKISKNKPQFDEDSLVVSMTVKHGSKVLPQLVRSLDDAGVAPEALSLHRPSLDDVFLALTGNKTEAVEVKPAKKGRRR